MSWSTIKTEAIILSAYPIREVDRRYKAITPAHGKIDFIGRGAQKSLAKLSPHIEPFAVLDLELVRGRRTNTVISVEKKHIFSGAANDLQSRLLALAAISLLDKYTNIGDQDEAIYHMLVDWLTFLDGQKELNNERGVLLLGAFVLRLMNRLGYEIDLSTCLQCGSELGEKDCRWHGARGGLICENCADDSRDWFAAREMSKSVLRTMQSQRRQSYAELLDCVCDREAIAEASKAIHELVLTHIPTYFERPFWSGIIAND